MNNPLLPSDAELPFCTDLYQLTMAAAYHAQGLHRRRCVFELFIRRLPQNRSYLVAAGLEQATAAVGHLRFRAEDTDYLRALPAFHAVSKEFFSVLGQFSFAGDIHAVPEGTVVFANEPLLRVSGTLLEAQIVETLAINSLHFQTAVASKAARIVLAARDRPVIEFGTRRSPGPQGALLAARAALIAGCTATSNVAAARMFDYPPAGTMAHSWIMAHDDEQAAFVDYANIFPDSTIALVDTYDVETGVRRAARLGPRLSAIRLDSGDLLGQSRLARRILDQADCGHVKILASGDLNEFKIDDLLAAGAPIDAFGVGTEMTTVADAPSLAMVYKLVEVEDAAGRLRPCIKTSADKQTTGRAKQVYRRERDGRFLGDLVAAADGPPLEGTPLLVPVVRSGKPLAATRPVAHIADYARQQISHLPESLRSLRGSAPFPIEIHSSLKSE
ncbi:MAG TPA: nicotinate phosphoribosyltransferase [Phycisphaerae bacterium]|nr:nicotinate phosphoribosyltransferase [Phycisphaerae bacterium]